MCLTIEPKRQAQQASNGAPAHKKPSRPQGLDMGRCPFGIYQLSMLVIFVRRKYVTLIYDTNLAGGGGVPRRGRVQILPKIT